MKPQGEKSPGLPRPSGELLADLERDWSRTFDRVTDAISLHDRHFTILRANPAFRALFPSVVPGQSKCYRLVHALDEPPFFVP